MDRPSVEDNNQGMKSLDADDNKQADYVLLHKHHDNEMEMRVVLIGKCGMGKSELGNSLFYERNTSTFKSSSRLNAGTTFCQTERYPLHDKHDLVIVDTPGLNIASQQSVTDTCTEIIRCVELLEPGPHIFILVLSVNDRFSGGETDIVNWLKTMFGNEVVPYVVVVFTGMDILETDGDTLDEYINDKPEVQYLLGIFGNRYIGINNVTSRNKAGEAKAVLKLIDKTIDANKSNNIPYFATANFQCRRDTTHYSYGFQVTWIDAILAWFYSLVSWLRWW